MGCQPGHEGEDPTACGEWSNEWSKVHIVKKNSVKKNQANFEANCLQAKAKEQV